MAVKAPPKQTDKVGAYGKVSVLNGSEEAIYSFGGHLLDPGNTFVYVHCSYDLQEFSNYKSGHAHVKTLMGYLKETPLPSLACQRYDLRTSEWRECPDMRLPFQLGDSATCVFRGKLWVAGGYTVQYDHNLKLFYQRPECQVWACELESEVRH